MMAEIGDPTRDPGKRAEETVPKPWRDSTTDGNNGGGVGVQGGNGNNANPSQQDGQIMWGGGQNFCEGGRSA